MNKRTKKSARPADPKPHKITGNDIADHWQRWLAVEPDQRLIVAVLRDDMGIVNSQVAAFPFRRGTAALSIDRQTRGRSPLNDEGTIRSRARMLAVVLGVDYLEDLRWPCRANSGLKCFCPECNLPPNIETRARGQEW